jgi:hypothetical protein
MGWGDALHMTWVDRTPHRMCVRPSQIACDLTHNNSGTAWAAITASDSEYEPLMDTTMDCVCSRAHTQAVPRNHILEPANSSQRAGINVVNRHRHGKKVSDCPGVRGVRLGPQPGGKHTGSGS